MTSKTKQSKHGLALQNARYFLSRCIKHNLAHSLLKRNSQEEWVKPYPEVTGYVLSYFCNSKVSIENLEQLNVIAQRLITLQHKNGGFPSFYDTQNLYTFDTAQIMHGLLSLYRVTKNSTYLLSAIKAGDFICAMQLPSGVMFPIYDTVSKAKVVYKRNKDGSNWGSTFSYIQVKNAEGLLLLHKATKDKKYQISAHLLLKGKFELDYLYTHPLAYYLEGLTALGEEKRVKTIIKSHILSRIGENGFLPYYPGSIFSYVSGSIQMAILLWKVGYRKKAKSILNWAMKVQSNDNSGGLYQYATRNSTADFSIHGEINSWGTKYYAELLELVVNS